jgi:hypothetical protein
MTIEPAVPSREELYQLYEYALQEYRFQVNLNWNRTQYFLTVNVGIIGIATGIVQFAKGRVGNLTAGIYLAGAVCCALSIIASRTQQSYYRATREHKAVLEERLALADLAIRTTVGMGSLEKRFGSVTTMISVVLSVLLLVNLAGVALVLANRY